MSDTPSPNWPKLLWGIARLPLLLAGLFVLRHPVLNAIEQVFDIIWITETAVDVMSTPATRLILFTSAALGLIVLRSATRRMNPVAAYVAATLLGAAAIWAVLFVTHSDRIWLVLLPALLALNWLPQAFLATRKGLARAVDGVVAGVPALGEGLFASRYLGWIARSAGQPSLGAALSTSAVPGAVILALALALFTHGARFATIEQALRGAPEVSVVARGDINGLALERTGRALIITGHGYGHLTRMDLATGAMTRSTETTGGAQGLAYDEVSDEVYLFDLTRRAVLVFDAQSLALKRSIPAPGLSPGDPWIGVDRRTDTVTLASEADEQVGAPLLILNRTTGAVVASRREEVGNLLSRPDRSLIYFSFFRRGQGVLAYDLERRAFVGRTPADQRVDRMAYDAGRNLLLVASPVEGRILRYDADTLADRGALPTLFGTRVIAIDATRALMLTGSFASGKIAAQDLETGEILQTWYVGPWLRTILPDPAHGKAYVSSNGRLYVLDYSGVRPAPSTGGAPGAAAP